MPTYVYRFVETGDTIEVQQAFTDEPLTEAINPRDGKLHAVRKVFTPVGVTFKGSGFYKTDSRSSSKGGTKSSSSGENGGSTSGSSEGASSSGHSHDHAGSSSGH